MNSEFCLVGLFYLFIFIKCINNLKQSNICTYVCVFRTCSVTLSSTLRGWRLCSPYVTCFCAMRMPAAATERMTPSSTPRSAWTSAGEIYAPCLLKGGWGMTIYPDDPKLKHTTTAHRCLVNLLHLFTGRKSPFTLDPD